LSGMLLAPRFAAVLPGSHAEQATPDQESQVPEHDVPSQCGSVDGTLGVGRWGPQGGRHRSRPANRRRPAGRRNKSTPGPRSRRHDATACAGLRDAIGRRVPSPAARHEFAAAGAGIECDGFGSCARPSHSIAPPTVAILRQWRSWRCRQTPNRLGTAASNAMTRLRRRLATLWRLGVC